MITYFVCLLSGLVGIGLVFAGRKNELVVTLGAAIYFIALFVAAIHSIHSDHELFTCNGPDGKPFICGETHRE